MQRSLSTVSSRQKKVNYAEPNEEAEYNDSSSLRSLDQYYYQPRHEHFDSKKDDSTKIKISFSQIAKAEPTPVMRPKEPEHRFQSERSSYYEPPRLSTHISAPPLQNTQSYPYGGSAYPNTYQSYPHQQSSPGNAGSNLHFQPRSNAMRNVLQNQPSPTQITSQKPLMNTQQNQPPRTQMYPSTQTPSPYQQHTQNQFSQGQPTNNFFSQDIQTQPRPQQIPTNQQPYGFDATTRQPPPTTQMTQNKPAPLNIPPRVTQPTQQAVPFNSNAINNMVMDKSPTQHTPQKPPVQTPVQPTQATTSQQNTMTTQNAFQPKPQNQITTQQAFPDKKSPMFERKPDKQPIKMEIEKSPIKLEDRIIPEPEVQKQISAKKPEPQPVQPQKPVTPIKDPPILKPENVFERPAQMKEPPKSQNTLKISLGTTSLAKSPEHSNAGFTLHTKTLGEQIGSSASKEKPTKELESLEALHTVHKESSHREMKSPEKIKEFNIPLEQKEKESAAPSAKTEKAEHPSPKLTTHPEEKKTEKVEPEVKKEPQIDLTFKIPSIQKQTSKPPEKKEPLVLPPPRDMSQQSQPIRLALNEILKKEPQKPTSGLDEEKENELPNLTMSQPADSFMEAPSFDHNFSTFSNITTGEEKVEDEEPWDSKITFKLSEVNSKFDEYAKKKLPKYSKKIQKHIRKLDRWFDELDIKDQTLISLKDEAANLILGEKSIAYSRVLLFLFDFVIYVRYNYDMEKITPKQFARISKHLDKICSYLKETMDLRYIQFTPEENEVFDKERRNFRANMAAQVKTYREQKLAAQQQPMEDEAEVMHINLPHLETETSKTIIKLPPALKKEASSTKFLLNTKMLAPPKKIKSDVPKEETQEDIARKKIGDYLKEIRNYFESYRLKYFKNNLIGLDLRVT